MCSLIQIVFVMPSSSARCAQLPRAEDKLPFFVALRKLRDFVRGELAELPDSEVVFADYTEFRVTQPDPKSLRKAERRRKRKAEAAAAAAMAAALASGASTADGTTMINGLIGTQSMIPDGASSATVSTLSGSTVQANGTVNSDSKNKNRVKCKLCHYFIAYRKIRSKCLFLGIPLFSWPYSWLEKRHPTTKKAHFGTPDIKSH